MPDRASFPRNRHFLTGTLILVAGLLASLAIFLTATEGDGDVLAYEFVDGVAYVVPPSDSKLYRNQLERFGGKAAVFADELNRWFAGLWRGKRLAATVAVLSLVLTLGFYRAARKSRRKEEKNEPQVADEEIGW